MMLAYPTRAGSFSNLGTSIGTHKIRGRGGHGMDQIATFSQRR
jgi:hypothetical protein